MEEIWASIPGYQGLYEASNLGRIRTAEGKTTSSARFKCRKWKQRIMKQKFKYGHNRKRSDAMVCLWKDGKPKYHLVSRIIASTFIEDNLQSDLTVNHIDGNPLNNNSNNLEWLTRSDNVKYGFKNNQYQNLCHPVKLVNDDQVIEFKSFADADRWLKKYNGYVSRQIKNRSNAASNSEGVKFIIVLNYE